MTTMSNNDIASAIYIASFGKEGKEAAIFFDNVVKFLLHKKLFRKSKNILEKLEQIVNKEKGLLKVKIYSVKSLDGKIKKDLTTFLLDKYKVKHIIYTEINDAKFIGGFKIEVNDEVIDLTIFNKLKKLQKYLTR